MGVRYSLIGFSDLVIESNTPKTYVVTSDHRLVTASFSLKWPMRKSCHKSSLNSHDIRSDLSQMSAKKLTQAQTSD